MTPVIPIIAALAFSLPPVFGGPDTPVKAAARARQNAVKSLDIRFHRTEVMIKGGKSAADAGNLNPVLPQPYKDTTLESTSRLVLDGVKIRFEDYHPNGFMPVGSCWLSAFDGTTAKMFDSTTRRREALGFGKIETRFELMSDRFMALLPLTLTFRGLDRVVARGWIDKLTPSEGTVIIDGVPCREYVLSSDPTWTLWFDLENDYIVRRIWRSQPRGQHEQTEIRYRANEVCGWVPVSWERTQYGPDGVVGVTNKVEELDLRLNEDQPPELFDIVFPPGSEVADYTSMPYKNYLAQPDGSWLELRGPEPVAWYWQPTTWVYVGLGLGLGYVVLVGVLRIRKGRAFP